MEDFAAIDYENTYSKYTDTVVEAVITQAERWVNEHCGQTFTASAAPDGVEFATLEMARYLMNRQMLEDKYLEELPIRLSDILRLCKDPLAKHKVAIGYISSVSDYDLRLLKG